MKYSQRPAGYHENQSLEVPRIFGEEIDSTPDFDIPDFLRWPIISPILSTPVRLIEAGRGTAPLRSDIVHHVHDGPILVARRRRALVDELGRQILWMNRTHSAGVGVLAKYGGRICLDIDSKSSFFDSQEPGTLIGADGVIIDERDWPDVPAAAVMTADCMPVLLSSAGGYIVVAVYAGHRGLLDSILTQASCLMCVPDPFAPAQAFTAPSICGRYYEMPTDMRIKCVQSRPRLESTNSWGTPVLDLPGVARTELLSVDCQRVATDPRCTSEGNIPHSYRRDPSRGRNAVIVSPRWVLDLSNGTLTDILSRVGHHYWRTKAPGGDEARLVRGSQPMRPGHGLSMRWSSHTVISSVRVDRKRARPAELAKERSQHGEVIV